MPNLRDAPLTLHSNRLLLRSPRFDDAPIIATLAHNPKIATMTATIPYPYPLSAAEDWIQHVVDMRQQGQILAYIICAQTDKSPMGVISLRKLHTGEFNLGYWLGEPYWGHGFCTEAGRCILEMAKDLGLYPIIAKHLQGNEPSKNVILNLGFQYIGTEIASHRGEDHIFLAYQRSEAS